MGYMQLLLTICRRAIFCAAFLLPLFNYRNSGAAEEPVNFSREVLPILSNKCFVCHGPDTTDEDQLRLDSFEAATADRGGYHAINVEEPDESELLVRIHSDDNPMPPEDAEKQLTSAERDVLTRWVKSGGAYAKHWSFISPRKSKRVGDGHASKQAIIDSYVLDGLKRNGVGFAEQANVAHLARRVALVLTGLPPEPGQLDRFLANERPEAFEELVQELLDSSRFGEHQARYWLDAVRYGDTHGLHLDNRRGIYPYRDWVVRSFNENLRLDDFIVWQIAGDLLPDPTLEQQIATGYVRLNPTTSEGGVLPEEFQCKNNFDRVETLGTVFLGMSLTCARCHNHKYDPITQDEYYRLLAFFNSTAEPPLDGNKYEFGPTIRVPKNQHSWREWQAIESEIDSLIKAAESKLTSTGVATPAYLEKWNKANRLGRLSLVADDSGPLADSELRASGVELSKRRQHTEKNFTTTLVAKDLDKPRTTRLLKRGEYNQPIGEPLQPGVIKVMGALPEGVATNRMGLAKWLVSNEHPLVARVLVNRIWQRVFGAGLVRTTEDFGLQGQQPTHPELLDWLAVELQESEWNLKHMLKMLVTTRTFQQSSAWRLDIDDPENRWLARGPRYRLDAEVLRDIGLWASELLDPHMGGEGVKPYQPAGMWLAMAHPASNTKKYVRDKGQSLYRRSLYVYWKRTSPHPMMTLFDAPDRESSCVRRSRTNTSSQSLGLLNETQRIEIGRKLAERLLRNESDEARFRQLFKLLACRSANETELQACRSLLDRMRRRYRESNDDAIALLSIGDATRDESLDPAEHAAWTQVAITVLASDVAILLY